jgi:hypothetical protein
MLLTMILSFSDARCSRVKLGFHDHSVVVVALVLGSMSHVLAKYCIYYALFLYHTVYNLWRHVYCTEPKVVLPRNILLQTTSTIPLVNTSMPANARSSSHHFTFNFMSHLQGGWVLTTRRSSATARDGPTG